MSGLTETLRAIACQKGGELLYQSRIEWKAADEIERLRANIDAMNCNRDHVYPLTLADHTKTIAELRERIAELEADNATLRERQDWSRDVLHNINQIWSDEIERQARYIKSLEHYEVIHKQRIAELEIRAKTFEEGYDEKMVQVRYLEATRQATGEG